MNCLMVTEDRDLAYLILDTTEHVDDACNMTVKLAPDVRWDEVSDEDNVLWLMDDKNNLTVVRRENFDFDSCDEKTGYPIPTPVIFLDKDEYDRRDKGDE